MTPEQFSEKVSYGPGKCWTWTGRVSKNGYGRCGNREAHRVAYELFVGPIPEGADLDHLCNRKICVNPFDCLRPVSRAQNTLFGVIRQKGQMSRKRLRVSRLMHEQVTERIRVERGRRS